MNEKPIQRAYIRSIGHYLPEKRLTNHEIEEKINTTNEWIIARTGISERRILKEGLGNSYMAIRAAKECLRVSEKNKCARLRRILVRPFL